MKKIFILFGLMALVAAMPLFVPDVFYTGFEDGDRTAGGELNLNSSGLSCAVDGMQVSSTFHRTGSYSIHSICRYSDALCGLSHRDEFSKFKNNADSIVKDRFYNFSVLMDDFYPGGVVDNKDLLIMQIKSTSQDNFPFVAIWIRPDVSGLYSNYVLVINYSSTVDAPTIESQTSYTLGRVYSTAWVDFTMDIDWQYNSSGSTKIYMNGTLVRSVSGQNMNPPFNPAAIRYPNFRCGIYQFGWNSGVGTVNRHDAYYDEIKVGTTGTVSDYFIPVVEAMPDPKFILTNYQAVKVN